MRSRRKIVRVHLPLSAILFSNEILLAVFSISLGNLLPNEKVTINLSYINPLLSDESADHIRFTIPRAYMQRSGRSPTDKIDSGVRHENVPFTVDVNIQQAGPIHGINVRTQGSSGNKINELDNHFGTVDITCTDVSGSSEDVLIVINADGLHEPRAFVEPHPSPDQSTVAVGLTFVPRFDPVDSPCGMEYIYLVDCNKTMAGDKIKLTKAAINILWAQLPSDNSFINVFSYGATATSLWPQSRAYDRFTVAQAEIHVD